MKSFFKRSAISLVVIGMAGSVYAKAPVQNNNSWSPQVTGVFLGVEGLDLRPQNGDLDYVTVFPTVTGGSFNTNSISTSYHWGWRVYGGIKVTENDDLTLSYMQLNNSNSNSVSPDFATTGMESAPRWLTSLGLTDNEWMSVNGHVNFRLNDAYAVWGHTINFNNPWSIRFAGGVEWATIKSNMTVTAQSDFPFPPGLGTVGFESKSNTRGVGPRAEMDMTYHLPYGFALFGNLNGALLASTRDISLDPTNTVDTDGFFFSSNFSNRHVVIPKFGMRLGVNYAYTWGQAGGEGCRATTLMVDAGWQAESYIHAIERPEDGFTGAILALQRETDGTFAETKTSNFSDSGLFVGVTLGTDWM